MTDREINETLKRQEAYKTDSPPAQENEPVLDCHGQPMTLETVIGQCIGEASMQWEFNDRGGVYQSDAAVDLLNRTLALINRLGYFHKDDWIKIKLNVDEVDWVKLNEEKK